MFAFYYVLIAAGSSDEQQAKEQLNILSRELKKRAVAQLATVMKDRKRIIDAINKAAPRYAMLVGSEDNFEAPKTQNEKK